MTDIFIDGVLVTKIEIVTDKVKVDFYDKDQVKTHSYIQGEIKYYQYYLEDGNQFRIYKRGEIEEWRI